MEFMFIENWIFSLTPESWTAIFSGISVLIITIGTIIAVRELKTVARSQNLCSIKEFIEDFAATAEDRKFIYQKFNFSLQNPQQLSSEEERRVQNVVNSLNRIGLLLENELLSPVFVFSISHTTIIRCWYKLEDYVIYHEERIGGRYGRRLPRIVKRAKDYHDIHSSHRKTKIKIDFDKKKKPLTIYKTTFKKGFSGIVQKFIWKIKEIFKIY